MEGGIGNMKIEWFSFKDKLPEGKRPIWYTKKNSYHVNFLAPCAVIYDDQWDKWCYVEVPDYHTKKQYKVRSGIFFVGEEKDRMFIQTGRDEITCNFCPFTGKKSCGPRVDYDIIIGHNDNHYDSA